MDLCFTSLLHLLFLLLLVCSNLAMNQKNILGGELEPCSFDPLTGWFRDGYCRLGEDVLISLWSFDYVNFAGGRRYSSLPWIFWWCEHCCRQDDRDHGSHTVCAEVGSELQQTSSKYVFLQVTQGFLEYTKGQGNDLSTPRGGFPGLKPGDMWCLCAARWRQVGARHVWPCFLAVTQFVSWLLSFSHFLSHFRQCWRAQLQGWWLQQHTKRPYRFKKAGDKIFKSFHFLRSTR